MSEELTFYTNPMSRGRIVRWMLEELGIEYRTEIVEYGPVMKAAAYTAINPMGKVPSIVHGGITVTEVAAILAYLADAFPAAGLAPSFGSTARGSYYRWLFFAAGPLEQAVVNRSFGFELPPEGSGRAGYGSYEDVMNAAEQAVSTSEFLAGGKFSAADLYMSAHLGWGMMFGSIEKRPAFERYIKGKIGRPAAIRAKAIDDALMGK